MLDIVNTQTKEEINAILDGLLTRNLELVSLHRTTYCLSGDYAVPAADNTVAQLYQQLREMAVAALLHSEHVFTEDDLKGLIQKTWGKTPYREGDAFKVHSWLTRLRQDWYDHTHAFRGRKAYGERFDQFPDLLEQLVEDEVRMWADELDPEKTAHRKFLRTFLLNFGMYGPQLENQYRLTRYVVNRHPDGAELKLYGGVTKDFVVTITVMSTRMAESRLRLFWETAFKAYKKRVKENAAAKEES